MSSSSSLSSWRLRQAADDFLAKRKAADTFAPASAAAAESSHANMSIDEEIEQIKAKEKASHIPDISAKFNVEGVQERLKIEKLSMVKFAFDAAATFVMENTYSDDEDDDVDKETNSCNPDHLPEITELQNLEDMRVFSFVRAVENKDLTKRKDVNIREQKREAVFQKPVSVEPKSAASTAKPTSAVAPPPAAAKIKTEPGTNDGANKKLAPASKSTGGKAPADAAADQPKKFSRNTPASSLTALETRLTSSRAILCTTANVVFDAMTPALPGHEIDIANVPQNPGSSAVKTEDEAQKVKTEESVGGEASTQSDENSPKPNTVSNMGTVVVEAQTLGKRIEKVATTSLARSKRRYQYRKDLVLSKEKENKTPKGMFRLTKNPFAWDPEKEENGASDDNNTSAPMDIDQPASQAKPELTTAWKEVCLPRLLSVMETGFGNAVIHDVHWSSRHGRVANLMQEFAKRNDSFGPHLIVTTTPDTDHWIQQFKAVNSHLRLLNTVDESSLRALAYKGDTEQRRKLRHRFSDASGLANAAYHVIVTSYENFLKDYLHFCQTPFEIVLLDDGCSWMGVAGHGGGSSSLAKVWEEGIFAKNDHSVGLAGSFQNKVWDYDKEEFNENHLKHALVGLTARHRLMTSSKLRLDNTVKNSVELLPIAELVKFTAPHFADMVREEWDRSRITNDDFCLDHFQKLLARTFVVHDPSAEQQDLCSMALTALQGSRDDSIVAESPDVPEIISDTDFVEDHKISLTRRYSLQWLGHTETSWLRYELGSNSFENILKAMASSHMCGHVCEEITTTLATSNAGSTGQITGSLAYKFAVRCGKTFTSEQGLRPHVSSHHALPGTWLCRTCGADCVTSIARTHHERNLWPPKFKAANHEAPPAAGKVGRPKGKSKQQGTDKKDGPVRVKSYRGVWVNAAGKHFIKIKNEQVNGEEGSLMMFESADEAAKKYDAILREKAAAEEDADKNEFNFKPDGSRIKYEEDAASSSSAGLGGSADSVVPALSVINIQDLPKGVKPLLRDPRQTSRTGETRMRHVYAYRGVCRQARKGHDRWQSQISFCGRNFYLGTYESEWDAAAIYAWAHLILYGKEATDQAQKEGEEAAAAFEKEQRDIAAGIIPPPAPAPAKKEKKPKEKKRPKKRRKQNRKRRKSLRPNQAKTQL